MRKCKTCNTDVAKRLQFCEKCRIEKNKKANRKANKKFRKKRGELGICIICTNPKKEGREKCQYHLDLAKNNSKNWYQKNSKSRVKKPKKPKKPKKSQKEYLKEYFLKNKEKIYKKRRENKK